MQDYQAQQRAQEQQLHEQLAAANSQITKVTQECIENAKEADELAMVLQELMRSRLDVVERVFEILKTVQGPAPADASGTAHPAQEDAT